MPTFAAPTSWVTFAAGRFETAPRRSAAMAAAAVTFFIGRAARVPSRRREVKLAAVTFDEALVRVKYFPERRLASRIPSAIFRGLCSKTQTRNEKTHAHEEHQTHPVLDRSYDAGRQRDRRRTRETARVGHLRRTQLHAHFGQHRDRPLRRRYQCGQEGQGERI